MSSLSAFSRAAAGAFSLWLMYPASAQTDAEKKKAKAIAEEAYGFFERQDYTTALTLYQRSYELWKNPSFLYNVSLCHRKNKRPQDERATLCSYLDTFPDTQSLALFPEAPPQDKIEARLQKLLPLSGESSCPKRLVALPETLPTTSPTSQPQPTSAPTSTASSLPASFATSGPVIDLSLKDPPTFRFFLIPAALTIAGGALGVGAFAFKTITEQDNEVFTKDYRRGVALASGADILFVSAGVSLFFSVKKARTIIKQLPPTKPLTIE